MGDTRKTKAQLLNELQSLRGRLVGEAADPAAQTQEYLYEMFDGAAHAAFVVGTDFTVLHANQALVDMTGLKRERILGSKCCQTIGKSRCKSDSCALHQVFSGTDRIGPLMIRDICGRDDSGSMLTAWAVRDGDSKVKGACVELDARAEQMRAILALMEGIAIAIYDLDGMILAVWSNNEECYGISLDDLRGKTLRDVYPPELAEARIDRIRQAATAPEPLRDVYYAPLPASGRWLETALSPIRDAAGNASSVMGLIRDITALHRTEERYRVMFNQSADSILVVNPEGILTDFNTAAHENLGYTREEFEKLGIADIDARESLREVKTRIAQIAREGFGRFETKHRTKQGELRDVLVISKVVHTFEEPLFVSTCRDVTEEKQTQEALRRKNIAMQEIIAGVEDQKNEVGRTIISNVEKIIMPLLNDLERGLPPRRQKNLQAVRESLQEITSPFAARLSKEARGLSPAEIRICNFVRGGMPTKDIAQLLHVSPATVNKHREHIRQKLGIAGKDINLATYLASLAEDRPES